MLGSHFGGPLGRRAALLGAVVLFASQLGAQTSFQRYALILDDPAPVTRATSRDALQSVEEQSYRTRILSRQTALRTELGSRKFQVTGSVSTLANAVFVAAPKQRLEELKSLPGVKGVVLLRRRTMSLNTATQLVNAPAAWNTLGGVQNGGKGVRIAILDSGVDNTHPAFQDSSLTPPAGFPVCDSYNAAKCSSYTNNKIIVARSYVKQMAAGSDPSNPAADSRPDDYSPRDHLGHGTATASCAAAASNTGSVTFSGMAPKAFIGNYRILGSPMVNDLGATDDILMQAAEDAFNDGMNVISFSLGAPAFTAALDAGPTCGNPAGVACDPLAKMFNDLTGLGVTIVAAQGNDGEGSLNYPNLNSSESPANAPGVIAAGATTNSHFFNPTVSLSGSNPPSNLLNITAQASDSGAIAAVTAPLVDTTALGDAYACSQFASGSLSGSIALISRGPTSNPCTFSTKAAAAADAGAVGILFYMADSSAPIGPGGVGSVTYIPAVMISNASALALRDWVASHTGYQVTIDPNGAEASATPNLLAYFSSRGPSTGDLLVKPDVLAPGEGIYMATQVLDQNGEMYSSTRYIAADGTSFSTPITSGAAALVKQAHPSYTPAQIKSALVSTATQEVTTDDSGYGIDVLSTGAGKIDANAAILAPATFSPSTVTFGALAAGAVQKSQQIQVTNTSSSSLTLNVAISTGVASTGATLSLDKTTLTVAAGASGTVTLTLAGSAPAPGVYYGAVTFTTGSTTLRVPYQYLMGDGVPANLYPMSGSGDYGTVGQQIPEGIISLKVTDRYGVPVANTAVTWTARNGGSIKNADAATDSNGIAAAEAYLGSAAGQYSFRAVVTSRLAYTFSDYADAIPAIFASGGVVNGASFDASAVAPGSYISIFGSNLADSTGVNTFSTLPMALNYITVSFDAPSAGISVPARLVYVSPSQVNVQVPWELKGQKTALMKVSIDYTPSNVVTVNLSDYSPAFFEISSGVAAALDTNYKVVTASNPVARGQTVQLYANGLGPVSNTPESGAPAPSAPLAYTTATPTVTIGGVNAPVAFSGLAPGFAGLYQLNVTVPSNISAGSQPLVVTIGGTTSKTSGISVQ
ncbi:MAG: S8 family serine peptidase [Acidobacteria bacterium]|nr:S8 family serine peptidase [Acidobacteriota bacterium]